MSRIFLRISSHTWGRRSAQYSCLIQTLITESPGCDQDSMRSSWGSFWIATSIRSVTSSSTSSGVAPG